MSGVNKVILVGNLGADPETRALPNGDTVANLRIATSEKWKDKASGEKKERTEWHKVVIFGKLADIAAEYLTKGSTVYLEGKIQTQKWVDKEGQERYTTQVVANVLHFLSLKREGGDEQPAPSQQRAATATRAVASAPKPAPAPEAGEFEDDDLPF